MSKRHLQIALGCLWLLNGIFQLQPKMFTGSFAKNVILSAAVGQPYFVSDPIHWAVSLFMLQPIMFNTLIALVQISIGALILTKRTTKTGLVASVLWGLFVWGLGEAFGGIFTGHFNLLMGAPGAAFIYVVLSFAAYPRDEKDQPAQWLVFVWATIWLFGAIALISQQQPTNNLHDMVLANMQSAPSWISSVDIHVAGFVGGISGNNISAQSVAMSRMAFKSANSGYWLVLLLGLAELFVALGLFLTKKIKYVSILLGGLLMAVFWIIGQNAAGYYSGIMTDLNTAPLILLMGLCLLKTDVYSYIEPSLSKLKARII